MWEEDRRRTERERNKTRKSNQWQLIQAIGKSRYWVLFSSFRRQMLCWYIQDYCYVSFHRQDNTEMFLISSEADARGDRGTDKLSNKFWTGIERNLKSTHWITVRTKQITVKASGFKKKNCLCKKNKRFRIAQMNHGKLLHITPTLA